MATRFADSEQVQVVSNAVLDAYNSELGQKLADKACDMDLFFGNQEWGIQWDYYGWEYDMLTYFLLASAHPRYICFMIYQLARQFQGLVGGDWNMAFMTFHILGIDFPQLMNSIIFRGVGRKNTNSKVIMLELTKRR